MFFFKMCVYIYTYICVYYHKEWWIIHINSLKKNYEMNVCIHVYACTYICIHMCLLPFPAVANYSKLVALNNINLWPFTLEWSISLPFPPSRGCLHSWLVDTISIFPTSSLASSNVCFCCHIAFSCLPFTRTPVVTLGPAE